MSEAAGPVGALQTLSMVSAVPSMSQGLHGLFDIGGSVASPMAWVIAAAARRELGQPSTDEIDRQTIARSSAAPATVAANRAPVIGTVRVGQANTATGVVTGTVSATDADINTLIFGVPAASAKGGAAVINSATGAFTYTPVAASRHAASALGATTAVTTDSFTVTVSDGLGGAASKTITVPVSPKNTAPTVKSSPTVDGPNLDTGVVTGALGTADSDGDVLSYKATPTKGTITFGTGGSFTYTPTAPARHAAAVPGASSTVKTDSFTVTVSDGHGGTATKSLSVPVVPANAGPVITSASAGAPNASTGVVAGTVIATDADKDTVAYTATATTRGKVSINATTGAFTYTATATARHAASSVSATDADKQDTVTVTVTDGHGGVASKMVTVAIAPQNSAPTTSVSVGSPSITSGIVTGKVTGADANNDALNYTAPTTTALGAVAINATTGAFTYTPTDPARHAAAAIGAPASAKTDVFTVTVTDAHGGTTTRTVTVAVAPKNTAPTVAATTRVDAPTASGLVTGSVGAADADGDVLSYKATPTKGTIAFGAGGSFTYTPTAGAQAAAANANAPASAKQDTFTVAVSDNYGGTVSKSLTVPVAPPVADGGTGGGTGSGAGPTVIGSSDVPGAPWLAPLLSADGTRTVVTTFSATGFTTRLAVFDKATGAQVGTTVTLAGLPEGVQLLNADASRTLVTTMDATTVPITRVKVINPSTGAQTGTTLTIAGDAVGAPLLTADGTRAVITTRDYNTDTGINTARVAVFDTVTGTQIGATVGVSGYSINSSPLSADGTRALITTYADDPATHTTVTRVAVINTVTGTQTGTFTFQGDTVGSMFLTNDGSRVLVATEGYDSVTRRAYIKVSTIDTATGIQTDAKVTGAAWRDSLQLSADSTHALITTYIYDWDTATYTTGVASIVTATGALAGPTVILAGSPWVSRPLSADGTIALVSADVTRVVDTVAGTQTDDTPTLPGYPGLPVTSADGAHVLIVSGAAGNTSVAVVDTATGEQVGTTITVPGVPYDSTQSGSARDPLLLSADGTRALITTSVRDPVTGMPTTRVTRIDTVAGTQSGTTVDGYPLGSPQLNPDRTRAMVTTGVYNPATGTTATQVAVIDTATGTQIGTGVTLTGAPSGYPVLSADGTRAFITTFVSDPRTGATTATRVTVLRIA